MINFGSGDGASGSSIGDMISSVFQIAGGIGAYRLAHWKAKEERKLNDRRTAFQRRQVERAYKENYAKMMVAYADARSSIDDQFRQGREQVTAMVQQQAMNGIDVNESSLRSTAKAQLESEFSGAINRLIAEQSVRGHDLFKGLVQQELGIDLNHSENNMQITNAKIQSQAQAGQQILDGIMNFANTAMNMKKENDMAKQSTNNMQNNTQYVRQPKDWFNSYNSKYRGMNSNMSSGGVKWFK